jgi:CBS domain-containing protein
MGEHQVKKAGDHSNRKKFINHLLSDIAALEQMLRMNMIEDDVVRIGAEQEFCLVNEHWRPAVTSGEILEEINDPHFTTELARFNLEINLDPVELRSNCFSIVEDQLRTMLKKARDAASEHNSLVLLTGILPTISKNELAFEYMTPNPRYWALNDMIRELRGSDFELYFKGVDELSIIHDSVLFEACNTSFQLHLQIPSDDFVRSYNWAQAISGPVLAASTNSPLLLGRELWSETRIALFQQSIDTRTSAYSLQNQQARVTFGNAWSEGDITDIFKNDIAQYKVILSKDIEGDAIEELNNGRVPKLAALSLHNGTIYRWNRPCYGVGGGKPHLRIECRYIPSGPSITDEMANFAFWTGLMKARPKKFDDIAGRMDFRDVKSNFIKAARTGKESVMMWDGDTYNTTDLVTKVLLPMAYYGLESSGIDTEDIERLLTIIEKRVKGKTGSQWKISNYRKLKNELKQDEALLALTKAIYENQWSDSPVHEWGDVVKQTQKKRSDKVDHIMSTNLFTVNENDPAELAISIMKWKNIHHVPVENMEGKLSGLLTWTHVTGSEHDTTDKEAIVRDIMEKKVITTGPDELIEAAIVTMKENNIGCLPVVEKNRLVGIITGNDIKKLDHE